MTGRIARSAFARRMRAVVPLRRGRGGHSGYDGEGGRVTKTDQSDTIIYVYDAKGRLAAEYGGAASTAGTQYLTADHLGSTRIITDASKAIVECKDYLPFGDEIVASRSAL